MLKLKALIEKPLIKIVVFGVLFFVLLFLTFGPKSISKEDKTVVIEETDIANLLVRWKKTWNRPPTKEEFDNLLESHIRKIILYEEALAQGLDENNAVVKNALVLQMNMIAENQGVTDKITDTDIEAYYKLRQDQFMSDAQISFTQLLFIGEDKNSRSILLQLQEKNTQPNEIDPNLGHSFTLPLQFNSIETTLIDRSFGTGFGQKVIDLPTKKWVGPIESSYGEHLIYIDSVLPSKPIPINQVRNKILQDMEYDSKLASKEQFYTELTNQYKVIYKGRTKEFIDGK